MEDTGRKSEGLEPPSPPLVACDDAGGRDRFGEYYEELHARGGDATAVPLSEVTGMALLLSRRLAWVLRDLQVSPRNLLDVGCGKGRWFALWSSSLPKCEIHGCDLSPAAIKFAGEHYPYASLQANTQENLPYPDSHFDMVVSLEVIEHVPDRDGFVAELTRVLKPGGLCLITTPCANRFSLNWFRAHLKPGGRIRTPYGVRWYMEIPGHLHRLTSREASLIFSQHGMETVRFYFWCHLLEQLDLSWGPWVRQPGKRFRGIRRRLGFLTPVFDALSNTEWALCKHWFNGARMIGVFRKSEQPT